jgi:hypothetical protein
MHDSGGMVGERRWTLRQRSRADQFRGCTAYDEAKERMGVLVSKDVEPGGVL